MDALHCLEFRATASLEPSSRVGLENNNARINDDQHVTDGNVFCEVGLVPHALLLFLYLAARLNVTKL